MDCFLLAKSGFVSAGLFFFFDQVQLVVFFTGSGFVLARSGFFSRVRFLRRVRLVFSQVCRTDPPPHRPPLDRPRSLNCGGVFESHAWPTPNVHIWALWVVLRNPGGLQCRRGSPREFQTCIVHAPAIKNLQNFTNILPDVGERKKARSSETQAFAPQLFWPLTLLGSHPSRLPPFRAPLFQVRGAHLSGGVTV